MGSMQDILFVKEATGASKLILI